MKTIRLIMFAMVIIASHSTLAQPTINGTVTPSSCITCPDGYIDITVTGGMTPYSFIWSNAVTTEDNYNLVPGIYSVTVIDDMLLTDTAQFIVTEADTSCTLSAFFNSSLMNTFPDSVVYEFNDMSTGGIIGSYYWNFGDGYYSAATNPIHAFTTDGLYNVELTISDPMMTCTDIYSTQITIDVPNDTSSPCSNHISTYAQSATSSTTNNGSIDVYFSMGQPPINYILKTAFEVALDSSGGTDMMSWTFDSLFGGIYIIEAHDAICTYRDTVEVLVDPCQGFYAGIDSSANASGPGLSDGLIRLQISGGTTPFSYLWSDGRTTQMITGLGAGPYSVTVTDHNGCIFFVDYFIYEEGCTDRYFIPSHNYINNPSPYSNDGAMIIDSIENSPKPYVFHWADDTTITGVRNNLTEGLYYFTVTDGNGCHIFANVELYADYDSCTMHADFTYYPLQTFTDSIIISFTNTSTGVYNAQDWNSGDMYSSNSGSTTQNALFTYYRDGYYDVSLVVYDSAGYCYDQVIKTVSVDLAGDSSVACNAYFTYSIVDSLVTFTNSSAGPTGMVYSWDFGDGTFSTVSSPSHIYARDGYYYVWLYALDSVNGCLDNYWQSIYIDVASDNSVSCYADFTAVTDGLTVDFNLTVNNNTLYAWDFGDGQFSNLPLPSHVYAYSGYYYVNLTTYDTVTGCVSSAGKDIAVMAPNDTIQPVNALFSYFISPNTTEVSFTDNSLGTVSNRFWTFGDGSYSEEKNPTHVYSSPGYYNVCLSINDTSTWVMSTECKELVVGTSACDVRAQFTTFVNQTNNSVSITNKSLGSNNAYFWNFGDGSSSTTKNPVKTFNLPGYYLISLSVFDTINGCSDYAYEYIQVGTVNCKADFDFIVNNTSKTATYKNNSQGADYSFWFFDDGDYSYDRDPVKTFAFGGRHITMLTIMDSMGMCFDFIEKEIQVGTIECSAEFTYYVDPSTRNIHLSNQALGDSNYYYWIFGDGEISTEKNPVHVFAYDGLYNISLSVYNMLTGCFDYTEQTVLIGSIGNDCEANFIYMADNSGNTIRFTNKSLCNSTQYQWSFGDNSAVSTEENPVHTYSEGGYYNVCLWTKNAAGIENITCKYIKVNPPADKDCYADFSFVVDSLTKKATFTDKSYGNPTQWKWYFGDGDSSVISDPVHVYPNRDYYVVQLDITNAAGCTSSSYQIVNSGTVDSLFGQFAYEKGPARKASGYPVDFVGIAHGDAAKLRWSFGDGTYDSVSNSPTHYYAAAGNYNVCLTVMDPITMESSTTCQMVRVGSTTQVVEITSGITAQLVNYPNPAKGVVHISYSIQNEGLVDLAIYRANGSKAVSLINTVKPAGSYSIVYDISGLDDGIYLLQLRSADGTITNKLVVE